jgi:hypothetical protein
MSTAGAGGDLVLVHDFFIPIAEDGAVVGGCLR